MNFAAGYRAAMAAAGGVCPIESGAAGWLADHECAHGRLPTDRTPPCGCWPQEPAPRTPITQEDAMELAKKAPAGAKKKGATPAISQDDAVEVVKAATKR